MSEEASLHLLPYPDNAWYAVMPGSMVSTEPVGFPFLDGEVVLQRRSDGEVTALDGRCAHRGCSLGKGWSHGDQTVCPYHGWRYDTAGQCVHIPALGPGEAIPAKARIRSYPVCEQHGLVWIWVSRSGLAPTYSVPSIPELEGQTLKTGGDIGFTYQTNYTRTVENGIDPTHAAFVHGKSIGKVDPNTDFSLEPYELQENPNDFHARMPIKVKKINGLTRFLLRGDASSLYKEYRFVYPNLVVSTVHFGRFALSALQAHVPETAGRTTVRVTNTRNFLRRTPLLSQWFDRVTASTGVKISSEDAEVITDQLPLQVKFKGSHEVLVRSDNILSAYRRWMSARLRTDAPATGIPQT